MDAAFVFVGYNGREEIFWDKVTGRIYAYTNQWHAEIPGGEFAPFRDNFLKRWTRWSLSATMDGESCFGTRRPGPPMCTPINGMPNFQMADLRHFAFNHVLNHMIEKE